MSEIEVIDTNEDPICPHCGEKIVKLLRKTHGIGEKHTVYFCPSCKKVLGLGNSR